MVASCVTEPIGLARFPFDGFHAGDERGGDRAHAGDQDPQLPFGGRNLDVVFIGQKQVSLRIEML
jgi:hypothetical protein